jgi:multidrug efflux system outer membrane protein
MILSHRSRAALTPGRASVVTWSGLLLAILSLTGCAVGPRYRPPDVTAPAAFAHSDADAFSTNEVIAAWWREFGDPLLERLIARASTNNHDLRVALARLHEARALWTSARFDFAPTVWSGNFYNNSLTSLARSPDVNRPSRQNELYRVGFDATWELDLWGRVRRNVEAARATVESVSASRDDLLVAIRAEVAANYLELRGLQGLLGVARRNATNQAETLTLAIALRDGGQGTQLDVARSRSLLNTTLATIPPMQAAVERALHRLSVLCGLPPGALDAELMDEAPLPPGPSQIAGGNPGDLIRRRPDVRAAERALAAATARIGVEVADLFPRVTFVGSIGLEAGSLSGFGASGTDAWSFGPHISWAAFDIGRVRAQIRAAGARAEGSLATYEQTVLLALEETENSFVNLARERQRLAYLNQAEQAAAEAVELARQRYRDGIADFLSVLDAERTLLSLQEQLVTSQTRAATGLVAVYKALGGGWDTPVVPEE